MREISVGSLEELLCFVFMDSGKKHRKVTCNNIFIPNNKLEIYKLDTISEYLNKDCCIFNSCSPLEFFSTEKARIEQYNLRFDSICKNKTKDFHVEDFFAPMIYIIDEKNISRLINATHALYIDFYALLSVAKARNILHVFTGSLNTLFDKFPEIEYYTEVFWD